MTPRWQRAALTPSWIRWLPCAFVYLTVVPGSSGFRRSAWSTTVPWDGSAWCDPGSVDEWVDRARRRRDGRDAEDAELHARQHYAWMVRVRATRIELFAEMCRRREVPVPHTVGELLLCLAAFGLFELTEVDGGDPWVVPRLDRDPLEVLPLSAEERDLEARAQRDDQAVLVAIAIRRLAQRTRRRWRRRVVSTSLTSLAGAAGVTEEQARRSLADLGQIAELGIDAGRAGDRLRLSVPWPDFRLRFPFTELPAPEHAI
ncbi:DUF6042 family protein [Micromonospora sp. WMMD1102]|uniref:DUF6042 family protein n=1 Tax=Micromonospora sp. WMMD1102 TaxID=3016105 RepID=UPI0024152159|nr:DUF6042 family protein [Micromonospora sp. WMMD1102]MDG4788344.1 DUF6042 family protein [Micromonospora sp. WMMD1102]